MKQYYNNNNSNIYNAHKAECLSLNRMRGSFEAIHTAASALRKRRTVLVSSGLVTITTRLLSEHFNLVSPRTSASPNYDVILTINRHRAHGLAG
jgi:hypothetical protein